MYQERFEELKHSGKLPSPSGVGMRILVLTQSDDFSMDDVVKTVQSDPALTGRVLKLATSVQMAGAVQVTTARDAAVRLGMRAVSNIALGFTLVSGNRTGKCEAFDYDRFWSESLATAVAAQVISSEMKLGAPPEAFTFGLLVGIGGLAFATVHPSSYDAILKAKAQNKKLDLATLEADEFYINHREVAAALLEEWGLPPYFSEVALCFDGRPLGTEFVHRETRDMLRILTAARMLADVCVSEKKLQPHMWPGLRRVCGELGASANEVCALFDRVALQWAEWGVMLNIPTNQVFTSRELENQSAALAPVLQRAEEAKEGLGKLRVLAVDDDPVSLRLLVTLLKRDGHDVLTARDGKEALAVYLEKGAQCVITDWMMPEMDGLMLCRQLRRTQEGRKLYLLILTGRTEEERIVEAFRAGVDDYIVKPFRPELLRARIQPALRVIQLQEDNDQQVREKERLNRQLDIEKRKFKAAAMTDALTELPNRRYAMKRLEKEWSNCQRAETSFSVVMLDIDHFKRVNDTWGHDVGDVVLKATARAIQSVLRRGDTCARIGGEEFLIICPNTSSVEGAMNVAERIRVAIEANRIDAGEFSGRVTASLGVGMLSKDTPSIDSILKMADEAVYVAKDEGRNRTVFGTPPKGGLKSA